MELGSGAEWAMTPFLGGGMKTDPPCWKGAAGQQWCLQGLVGSLRRPLLGDEPLSRMGAAFCVLTPRLSLRVGSAQIRVWQAASPGGL